MRLFLTGKQRAVALLIVAMALVIDVTSMHAATPNLGEKAPDFTLSTPEGQQVRLSDLVAKGKVVLIVLRGYPGYQCPYCQKQVHDLELSASRFAQSGAQLLLVYPGPPAELDQKAKEFAAKQGELPANFHLVIDPDYKFTNQYGLRWDAPHETAYPSTFVLNSQGVIVYRKVSQSHGDRATAEDVLAELNKER